MKTKQLKEDSDKSVDEDTVEPKTRARKKASDTPEEDKSKPVQDDQKPTKEPKKAVGKPKALVKKRPLGIRKTLRNKKVISTKEKLRNVVKHAVKRGRKPAVRPEPNISQEKDTVPLIPLSEIKKEPVDDTTPNSRSSSPKTAGRRQRLSSDMLMMKSVLGDSPTTLVLGPRTSPYSMRSERSNSPSMFEAKNLRSGKPRSAKSKLLSEVVMKEQKKRRRLLSDSKASESTDPNEDSKKLKRGRSCSRDGSEISKCSDITESDISLSETINDSDSKELNKKLDKTKTDLDVDIENNVQISTIGKVPSVNNDSKLLEAKMDKEPSCNIIEKDKKNLSLKRATSLDSDNNNSNKLKLENLNASEVEEKLLPKTENALFEERSSILTSMSKTFNSKEVSKNIRKARRGKRAAAAGRSTSIQAAKNGISSTITTDATEDKHETLDTLSKEINDLINDLDQNIDRDQEMANVTVAAPDQMACKPVAKFYGLSKPLGDNNSIVTPETPMKEKEAISPLANEVTPSKMDDSENIRLRYEEDSAEKSSDGRRHEIPFNCPTVASIDKLMDRLKEFEELDKRRQRQESEFKATDSKQLILNKDVVLIPKSGVDIKPLKDMQPARSPEKVIEKENVLSCFENNSAISIVKRDQVRKSIDVDLPNSVTLIKRNSFSARKESTSSNHSKESDAISVFEKSIGKDVTLTELRKSVDKGPSSQIDLHQFATLHPNTNQSLAGIVIDSSQISITPRVVEPKLEGKRKSRDSLSRKSSESGMDEDKMATIEKIKSPMHQVQAIVITAPVAVKSPESTQMDTEALAPPLDIIKPVANVLVASEAANVGSVEPESEIKPETSLSGQNRSETGEAATIPEPETPITDTPVKDQKQEEPKVDTEIKTTEEVKPKDIPVKECVKPKELQESKADVVPVTMETEELKPKSPKVKSARNSIESQAGPSNAIMETPESQKRKENVLRTLGLLTHKAANEAKIEKLKQKQRIYGPNYCGMMGSSKGKSRSDYTGTLKTVIKLSRSGDRDKKKQKTSLKMTFQKTKPRAGKLTPEVEGAGEDHYTVERKEGGAGTTSDGGHRKSHYSNRLNIPDAETPPEPEPSKETPNLVIPEKASSFSIHPGRLCMDQCFYCGGKFGLFDTPCHIAQMKSSERQRKVLDNEEKLTIDSCLCDACYRHVDRRANCPSYRKRPLVKPPDTQPVHPENPTENPRSPSMEEESSEDASSREIRTATCHTAGCTSIAEQCIRRKWLIKMRSSVNKLLKLECDYPGLHTIPLCAEHYGALAPLMACVLCRRRITKHHNVHFIHHVRYLELNPLLKEAGVPVQFTERPLLCKMCRNYCTVLQRPGHNDKYAQACRRRLLQIYNIELPPELEQEMENTLILDESVISGKQKKKARTKSKQRKSSEPDGIRQPDSESSERTTESSPEKEKAKEDELKDQHPIEEDIECLISTNKIPVPGAKQTEGHSDGSESETVFDLDTPLLPIDKRTELQYLLQKQNNPKQFIQRPPNLTQKQRNILKVHNPGVQKPSHHNRINEKNSKRIHKIGQIFSHKDRPRKETDVDMFEVDKAKEITILKNITLNEECTIETIPNKKPADINTLKNKWQMSESFTQVKKNLSELSKKLSVDKEPKKSDTKYNNPVKRLETNPSISVRELFPGEEEMNLQCNIEFNNVKGVTPEGWEKCNTIIQYDVETKKLWNDLQRPYGNQSSFLRHLILLEKYFRNGDLVLSHNASPNAANYSDSVQSRLRAYDNVVTDAPRRSEPAISLIEFRKKPVNGKSLLKSSQNSEDKDPKKFMPPPGPVSKPKPKSAEKPKTKQLPPELIAINTPNAQGRKAIQNVLHNIQQLVKGVSAADPTEVASAPLPLAKFDQPPKEKKDTPPKTDTPKKSKTTSKPWRPTLMPITPENLAKIAREPTQVAVDGRTLPSLVQVMSSGQRYHITLQDYNKMCIMRREKLQQLHDGEGKKSTRSEETAVIAEVQSSLLGNGGTVLHTVPATPTEAELQIGANAATILKSVGLKNITIAPIPAKPATVTSEVTSPAPMPKIPKSLTVIPQTSMLVPESRP